SPRDGTPPSGRARRCHSRGGRREGGGAAGRLARTKRGRRQSASHDARRASRRAPPRDRGCLEVEVSDAILAREPAADANRRLAVHTGRYLTTSILVRTNFPSLGS